MDDTKAMMGGIRELGKNPTADLYASFDAIRLQLASLKEAARRDDSEEAKDARKHASHFVALLEENDLWNELVKLRDADREPPANLNPTD